jgi:hypothetical protein
MPIPKTGTAATLFNSVVEPRPYIPDDALAILAPKFEDEDYCLAFVAECEKLSGREYKNSIVYHLRLLSESKNPLAKSILKNILLHGRKEGSPTDHYDGNRFITAEVIGTLSKKDRRDVLAKRWMVADLVDERSYHWNDAAVLKWLGEYKPADRLEILSAGGAVDHLLNYGTGDLRAECRAKVREWIAEQSLEGQRRILLATSAGLGVIQAFGLEGLEIVKAALPEQDRAQIIGPDEHITLYLKPEMVYAFLQSLSAQDREKFFDPEQGYLGNGPENYMSGAKLKAKYEAFVASAPSAAGNEAAPCP